MAVKTDTQAAGGLRLFFERGGLWRLVVFIVGYMAIYLSSGKVGGLVDPGYGDDDLLSSVGAVFFQVTIGLLVGGAVLIAFTSAMGWNAEIFGRQPIYRSWWMWLGPVIVAAPIVLRVFDIRWGGPALPVVLMVLGSGLMVGFVEELLFRGIAVRMLRAGGHGEWVVAALSSLLFGLSHGVNLFSGQSLKTVLPTIGYTIGFGIMMYLSMRAIGFLAGAMILHGLTDPTTILATGGVDKVSTSGASVSGSLGGLIAMVTILMVVVALVLLVFIRGRVTDQRSGDPDTA